MAPTRPYYADKGMSAAFYDTVTAADVRLHGHIDIYTDLVPAWRNTFDTAARHLNEGGLAPFHLPLVEVMRLPGPADLDLPVLDLPAPTGGRLQLYVREREFREEVGRLDQVIEYVELDGRG